MKQNEKVLVYLVTGLLVAILGIAVMFGSDAGRSPRNTSAPPDAGKPDAGKTGAGKTGAGSSASQPAAGTSGRGSEGRGSEGQAPAADPAAKAPALEDILRRELPGRSEPQVGSGTEPKPAVGGAPAGSGTAAESVLGVPAPAALVREQPLVLAPPTPASAVRDKLGRSERERDYRHVWASRGDTLSSLVLKWCGSVDEYLEVAQSLNEELVVLKAGQRVTLPWVDDGVVLAAFEARHPQAGPSQPGPQAGPFQAGPFQAGPFQAGQPQQPAGPGAAPPLASLAAEPGAASPSSGSKVEPSAAVDYREYTVKSGDALWTIASKHVGKGNAGKFIAQVRELNPGIDVEHLRVDQRIKLPGKPPPAR
jgi:hypothetical protein